MIETHMMEKHRKKWLAKHLWIRCIGYIINLVVQAFLFSDLVDMDELESYDEVEEKDEDFEEQEAIRAKFRLLGPLGKGHNILVHMRNSSGHIDYFRSLVGRMIPMDNRTR